jgi:uncharacterized repeat protein (TIGR03847 family)
MSDSFDYQDPDHFTTGTVGPLGQRVFYLQGRQEGQLLTLKMEKEQVGALGDYLSTLLSKLAPVSEAAPGDPALIEPVVEAWAVASIAVGYDERGDRVVVVVTERVEEEAEVEAASARFRVTRAQAAAFVQRARELIEAGRPLCKVCGRGMDPSGHICPRSNGHGRG